MLTVTPPLNTQPPGKVSRVKNFITDINPVSGCRVAYSNELTRAHSRWSLATDALVVVEAGWKIELCQSRTAR